MRNIFVDLCVMCYHIGNMAVTPHPTGATNMRHEYTSISYTEAKTLGNLWRVSLKYDGVWAKLTVDEQGLATVTNRRGRVLMSQQTETEGISFVAIGELTGKPDPEKGCFHIFDVVSHMGQDVTRRPHQERTKLSRTMWDYFGDLRIELYWVEVVWHHSIDMLETMVGAASIGNKHYDGVVLVHKHSRYNDRPHLKLKNAVSVDYVLTAINLSESKYHEGTAATITGALLIGGKLVDVCKVGNLPHKLRSALTLNPADYIGKVFEATGNKAFESGALRHPVWLRWRDDKVADECTLAQVKSQRPDARCGAA